MIFFTILTKTRSNFSLLDLSVAFDTIDHDLQLQRLEESLGVTRTVLQWFSLYLKCRTSVISIDKQKSDPTQSKYVPQRSVLFTINTMPLAKIIYHKLNYHFYADDMQLYISIDAKLSTSLNQSVDKVQQCVKEIKLWMNNNMLNLMMTRQN